MADDRYSWLDKDAAERLLRGEPVGSQVGDGARELEQLLKAAAAAGSGRPGSAALPGEEAALAAFRRAGHGPGAHPRDPVGGATLPTVRAARGNRLTERIGLARPFRHGFAVALAVCAISGIAVAAGTGVLPTPFHGSEPEPGASVSAAETPSTFETQEPATTTGDTNPTPGTSPGGRTPTPGATPSPGDSHGTGRTPDAPSPSASSPGEDVAPLPDDGGGGKKKLLLAVCKNYESGKRGDLDRDALRRLEAKAGGPDRVHAFCRQYLSQLGAPGGGSGDNDGAGGAKGGDGQGENGGNGGGGHHGGGGDGDEEGDSPPAASPSVSPEPGTTTPAPTPSSAPSSATQAPSGTLPTGQV
ncbi:hypothetical protein [Streptomyces sp. WZ-12]|uniref:hypothetical protein n=1 Tax=Streptomyces sp. WZ-12 TaxID=3030210 RepID=UPI0023810FF1|nr:hypothetical protein [Streptomyces sp. WZ-12]